MEVPEWGHRELIAFPERRGLANHAETHRQRQDGRGQEQQLEGSQGRASAGVSTGKERWEG